MFDDLKLEGFNSRNQIVELSLSIKRGGAFTEWQSPFPYIVVEFKSVFGIAASFQVLRIESARRGALFQSNETKFLPQIQPLNLP